MKLFKTGASQEGVEHKYWSFFIHFKMTMVEIIDTSSVIKKNRTHILNSTQQLKQLKLKRHYDAKTYQQAVSYTLIHYLMGN